MSDNETVLAAAREAIERADVLLIAAGAGMGVDSGLPDFRGSEGFWRAYPAAAKLGLRFEQLASPHWFERDPQLAWGFYGHRLNLYRATTPHAGFPRLLELARRKKSYFVFTSNVDGHFQAAGFDDERIIECHGSIHQLQCSSPCCETIWPNEQEVTINEPTLRAAEPLPRCPTCGQVARPNVLMFGDAGWIGDRTQSQHERFQSWLGEVADERLAVLEFGAGSAIPTVRLTCEQIVRSLDETTLIRINPRETHVPAGQIGLPMGSLAAIEAMLGI